MTPLWRARVRRARDRRARVPAGLWPAGLCPTLGRRRGVAVSGIRRMNEVNPRRARLVIGRVAVLGRVYHLDL